MIGTPAYFEATGVPQTPADLLAHQALIYEQRDGGASWAFRQGTSETIVTVRGRLRVSATEGIREGVLAGLGVAIASEWTFAPELKSGAVKSVLDAWSLPPVDLWAVFPAGRQASAKARAFASFIQTEMSNTELAAKKLGQTIPVMNRSIAATRERDRTQQGSPNCPPSRVLLPQQEGNNRSSAIPARTDCNVAA